jgi:hypothetical protein
VPLDCCRERWATRCCWSGVEFIDAHRDACGVEPIGEQLQVAPSTGYPHRMRLPSARSITDVATTAVIEQAFSGWV